MSQGPGVYAPATRGELASAATTRCNEAEAEALRTWARLLRSAIERNEWATVAAVEHAMRDAAAILTRGGT